MTYCCGKCRQNRPKSLGCNCLYRVTCASVRREGTDRIRQRRVRLRARVKAKG